MFNVSACFVDQKLTFKCPSQTGIYVFTQFIDYTYLDFKEILEDFDKVIESATFFSIDSEFTGLFSERTVPFCSPSEFYKKLHQGTDEYIIVQLGITAFQIDNGMAMEILLIFNFLFIFITFFFFRKSKQVYVQKFQFLCVPARAR